MYSELRRRLRTMITRGKLEIIIARDLRNQGCINVVCPATVRIAREDLINYLKCIWRCENENSFSAKFEKALSSDEFYFFLRNWLSEWAYQWKKHVRVVSSPKEMPANPNEKTSPQISKALFEELKWIAITTLVKHQVICGTTKIAEVVVKQALSEVNKKQNDGAWMVSLLSSVCRNARAVAHITGVLLWVVLPQRGWEVKKVE